MRKILLAAALALAASAGCTKSDARSQDQGGRAEPADKPAAEAKLTEMTVDQVDQAIASGQLKAVDVNTDHTRKKMGVVPGAILLTDDEDYKPSELPADKTAALVFYCANPG
ncbi:MAG TPA: hypothetical protein VGF94_04400 [Kofleriaceae bacterium]|jgi:iron uptake system EfeUOB component EfeO/EfeM